MFYPIGLCDVLEVQLSETCEDYSFSSSGIALDGDPENNLILKAYRLLQRDFSLPPVDISLVKQIPFGAGLGGGSADAAFMLKMMNEIAALDLTDAQLEAYAVKLGADCPVFIRNRAVFASGIGNIFAETTLSLEGLFLVLVKPDIHVSTPEAYSNVTPQKPENSLNDLVKLPVEQWKNVIVNDFEKSVFAKYPRIAEIKESLYKSGAVYASMSGSGSSVYGLFQHEPECLVGFDDCFVSGGELR